MQKILQKITNNLKSKEKDDSIKLSDLLKKKFDDLEYLDYKINSAFIRHEFRIKN